MMGGGRFFLFLKKKKVRRKSRCTYKTSSKQIILVDACYQNLLSRCVSCSCLLLSLFQNIDFDGLQKHLIFYKTEVILVPSRSRISESESELASVALIQSCMHVSPICHVVSYVKRNGIEIKEKYKYMHERVIVSLG